MKNLSRNAFVLCLASGVLAMQGLVAQEASAGLDLRATLTAQAVASNELTEEPRSGAPMAAGSRSVVYPTVKFNDNWFITGALQLTTRPYFYEELIHSGLWRQGLPCLQSTLNYSHVFTQRFGSGARGRDVDGLRLVPAALRRCRQRRSSICRSNTATTMRRSRFSASRERRSTRREAKWDARLQFANSSPANPRSVFAHDQYGNWAGGAGYTIRQGFRVGVSGYRGPYLDRATINTSFPGEANPNTSPASLLASMSNWAHGHTSVQGEVQKFVMPYTAIPTFRETAGYGELKQVLSPRWYIAVRNGYATNSASGNQQTLETATGFRPNRLQLIKVGYEYEHYGTGTDHNENTLAIQLVTTLHRSVGRE